MPARNRGRPTLSQGLDREVSGALPNEGPQSLAITHSLRYLQVYQVVRKIIDDQPETSRIRLSLPAIYDSIKKSNSSLNRKPKKLLEDSVERVLEVLKTDVLGDEEDSMEGDFEGLEEPPATVCSLEILCVRLWWGRWRHVNAIN